MAKKERMVVPGNRLADTIQDLARRGDSRKVCILNEEKHLLDIPLTVKDPAAPATILEAPVLAAIRAIGSLLNECTVEVEKVRKPRKKPATQEKTT
jgi:Domain of unknown function (DUF4342)